ncbi:Uma2 family endonuclease [Cohnella silvisoli]|uniref:Uma2 family endonuclease n=1 Tax=Cohnella silvisoli TaxID=2873699 RepID=A0ABV1KZM2_9BACL|nr:Uma2 family endonuclease [Cohnella silvisoli]
MDKKKKAADRIKEGQATYDIYAEMPDDGKRYEVIDGVLELMSPGPSEAHQSVSGELAFLLKQSCKSDYLIYSAPFDVILSDTNVVQPDIMMIHRSRLHIVTERGVEGPPDLVVEIVSPGSRSRDRMKKMKVYERFDVLEYWVIDPNARTLEQYRLDDGERYELHNLFEGDDSVASDKLPCVAFAVGDIFKEIIH